MLRIRSITVFIHPGEPIEIGRLRCAGEFASTARQVFIDTGCEVQSTRLATVPFPTLVPPHQVVRLARDIESAAHEAGFAYVSLGPALPGQLESYEAIPDALAATASVFFSGVMASRQDGLSLPAVRACAQVIQRASTISPDGFGNLRFAALSNVPPGAPFFPAAYHLGDNASFGIAVEAAELVVEALSGAASLEEARRAIVSRVDAEAARLEQIARRLEKTAGITFAGLDFTLAPFPSPERSTGTAMEQLGLPATGSSGTLAAAAFLAETLDRANYTRTGFNGLMLPVLEDAVLAQRAAEGRLSINDLLLYSTVCGTGLDTLPLPGNATVEQLSAVLLDLAALGLRLDKPLTARLMPIPGKSAGEKTDFDFAYFANSRILALPALPLTGLLAGDDVLDLHPRSRR